MEALFYETDDHHSKLKRELRFNPFLPIAGFVSKERQKMYANARYMFRSLKRKAVGPSVSTLEKALARDTSHL